MKKKYTWLLIGLMLSFGQSPAIAQTTKEHLVVESSRAQLGSVPLKTGQRLAGEDELKISASGKVIVMCLNGVEVVFTVSAKVSSKCPSTRTAPTERRSLIEIIGDAIWGRSSLKDPRSGLADIPYVLSPRKSMILTTRPEIRWNRVAEAESYVITLSHPELERITWEKTSAELNFQYPLELPALMPDEEYNIKITTSNFVASTEDGETVWLEVLGSEQQQELFGLLEELRQQDLSPQTEIILESMLYEKFELYSQAIAILSGYVREHPNAMTVRERLAELYDQIGLAREERREYQQIEALTQGKITEIRQRTLDRLADFAESNEEDDLAEKYRAESQQISQQLGY